MIKSMTGFGKHIVSLPDKQIVIEVKTLNSKQLDAYLKISNLYKEKEPEIRQLISKILERGKVEVFLTTENAEDASNYYINKPLVKKYYSELKEIAESMDESTKVEYLPVILKLPDVLKPEPVALNEKEWEKIKEGIELCLAQVDKFRTDEGEILQNELKKRIDLIVKSHNDILPLEKGRAENIRERINKKLDAYFDKSKVDENRFEQELIYYLEKFDITEENVRLANHCNYFIETLEKGGSIGRKLSFISQEIGREINTIGSKANDATIQVNVVLMKDELEKIKEQLFNIL